MKRYKDSSGLTVSKFILSFLLVSLIEIPAQGLFETMNNGSVDGNEAVAQVGNKIISAEEFFYSYEFGPSFPKRKSNSKETHLKYMINEKLIALEGYKEKVLKDEETGSMLSEIQSDLATEEMFRDEILSNIEIEQSEIDTIVKSKMTEVELKWLFSEDKEEIKKYYSALKNGASFDSLFNSQLNDSVFLDMRSMKTSAYSLRKNNPPLALIVDTLKAGNFSAPIHVNNEWYIIKLANIRKNMIVSETEQNKLVYEAKQAALKFHLDRESDKYVNEMMDNENPVIQKDAFKFLAAYIGKYVLSPELYTEWELEKLLEESMSDLGLSKGDEYTGIAFVIGINNKFFLDEFITWYRNRSLYIKFDKTNQNAFAKSLENYIWRMVRDRLLAVRAMESGYYEREWVKRQSDWWGDKIAYSAMRNKLSNSILIDKEEINDSQAPEEATEKMNYEMIKKMFRLIQSAKDKHAVKINNKVLDKIQVTEESNRKAIDFYAAKKGGLIPRPPYPTIDNEWAGWE